MEMITESDDHVFEFFVRRHSGRHDGQYIRDIRRIRSNYRRADIPLARGRRKYHANGR